MARKKGFTTEELEKAREWQDRFLRAREAHGEDSKEQQNKRSEDIDDERAPMVLDKEASGSYFQTTDPKRRG